MSSTFHTPSFGDEDFDLPPLTLPPPDGSTDVFPVGPSPTPNFENQSTNQNQHGQSVTSLASPGQGQGHHPQSQGQVQGQGQTYLHTFPPHQQQQAPQQNGYHHGYQQQQQNNHVQGYGFLPKFPPQTFDIPDIQYTNNLGGHHMQHMDPSAKGMNVVSTTVMATSQAMLIGMPQGANDGRQMLSPLTQGQVTPQVSPPGSNTTSPGRESSAEESSSDDSVPLAQLAQKRNAPVVPKSKSPSQPAPKKARTPKKRKKKDPNEPQKPVSAYALFFRDTQAAIKTRNPNASFGEVSKIVASMWDGLAEDHKNDYKKRTETAKKEYLKQLAAYRATLVSSGALENGDSSTSNSRSAKNSSPPQPHPAPNQQTRSSPPSHPSLPAPAMTTVPMTTQHAMTTAMPGMPLTHMPPGNHGNMVPNPGHMMGPPPPQHYGGMMGHGVGVGIGPMGGGHMPLHPRGPGGGLSPNTMVASPPEALGMHDGYMGAQVLSNSPPMAMDSPTAAMCVRNGCGNPAIHSRGWDNEYCSNDCVVNHCRDAFTQWVASRPGSSPYASVK